MRGYNKKMILSFAVFITIFVAVRMVAVPASFGDYGWYRGDSVGEFAEIHAVYATSDNCKDCHSSVYDEWAAGEHKTVNCETCKGPGGEHIKSPAANEMEIDRSRDFCALCHNQNPSRPVDFAQKDVSVHNAGQLCIECHDSHDPYLVWRDFYKKTAHVSAEELFTETCFQCHSNVSKFEAFSDEEEAWKTQVAKMNELFGLGLNNEQEYAVSTYIAENVVETEE
jgi:hypothetical protein